MTRTLAAPPILEFTLPPELEAHEPPEARGLGRDEVRLLVSRRDDDSIEHVSFRDITRFLDRGDLVVFNQSSTIPAAVSAMTPGRDRIDLHISSRMENGLWIVEPRKMASGDPSQLRLPEHGRATLLQPHGSSTRLWDATLDLPLPTLDYLVRWGRPIRYSYVPREWPLAAYQTIFGEVPGSAEMASAGRAFTHDILEEGRARELEFAPVLLHAGVASLERDEVPHEEYFEVSAASAEAVNRARERGSRVLAVGTTVVRALESAVDSSGRSIAAGGWTDLVISPQRRMRVVSALLTGLHEPRATHLAMLAALASPRHLRIVYEEALQEGYLWHEFGDLHLIL